MPYGLAQNIYEFLALKGSMVLSIDKPLSA